MIELCNVTKQYGETMILDHANYEFPERGIVCLMGPSGGGKTTLLNLLAGFDTAYSGDIMVGGTPLRTLNTDALCDYRRDNIGFVFQNYHLLPGYTVLENVCLAELHGSNKAAKEKEALSILERLGIHAKHNQKVETLSGGQKQRVAIARALMGDPQIILADEPTGALDRTTSTEIMELLRKLAADRLVVVITHDAKICDFADEIIHIKDCKIVSEQPASNRTAQCALRIGTADTPSLRKQARKNIRVHLGRYLAAAVAVSIGLTAFLFSLSFDNVMDRSIAEFQEKNTAFNNGYIKGADDGTILDYLRGDERIISAYYQYKLENISLTIGGKPNICPKNFPCQKQPRACPMASCPAGEKTRLLCPPVWPRSLRQISKICWGRQLRWKRMGKLIP